MPPRDLAWRESQPHPRPRAQSCFPLTAIRSLDLPVCQWRELKEVLGMCLVDADSPLSLSVDVSSSQSSGMRFSEILNFDDPVRHSYFKGLP